MKAINFFTIGVYGCTENDFFNKLIKNNIDTFCDIRRRRGVRGSKYSFVNSKKLQSRLIELGIKYLHILDLAPTNEIRLAQKNDDKNKVILKRDRQALSEVFISLYKSEILSKYNFESLFEQLEKINAKNVVLFCVESAPSACHHSLVTSHINSQYGNYIEHI